MAAAAWAAAIIFRLSVAASRLVVFSCIVPRGLTPQAMYLPPLRGLLNFLTMFLGLTPQAMYLPPLRGWSEP